MIIGKYIKLLLSEGKRVILPGFGNLKLKESGNAAAGNGDLMEPPGPRIRFDGGFSKDDGILADALANGEKIEQEEAKQQVLELVDAVKFALDKGEPFQLHDVGAFTRDSDGKVHFRVDPSWILHPEQFGLEPLDLLELDENEQIEEVPQEPVKLSNDEPFAVETERPRPAHRGPAAKTAPYRSASLSITEKGRTGRWRAIWIVAGALIIILVVLIMIPADKLNIPGRKTPPPALTAPEEVSGSQTTPPAEEMTEEESDFESLTPERLEEEPAETMEAEPRAAEQNKYFLIAGSFNHLRNASDLQDKLKAKGIDAEVMITENRMYRVSVGSFATIGEAETGLARVKSRPGLESCWILSN